MYPDLSYLFHDLVGTPYDNWLSIFKTFGLFLALSILVAAYLLSRELKRKAAQGIFQPTIEKEVIGKPASIIDLSGSFILGFAFGYKLGYVFQNFEAFKVNPASILISFQGTWFWAVLLGVFWSVLNYLDKTRQRLPEPRVISKSIYPHHRIWDITIIAALSGIVGAKLFDLIEHLPDFFKNPYEVFFSGGGLAIYGGLITGFMAVVLYLRIFRIPVRPVMDAVAPALIFSYGIGRLGCHFSGDGDWGIPNPYPSPDWWFLPEWLWAYDYPRNVLNWGEQIAGCDGMYCKVLETPVYPTPVYEIILSFAIGAFLLGIRKNLPAHGVLFFIYLILSGLERFLIEFIRINEKYPEFFNWSQAQLIASALIMVGWLGLFFLWGKGRS